MNACILWTGAVQSSGYGSVTDGQGGTMLAHRKAWSEKHGTIPGELTVDHLCRTKLCINTDHMELVTRSENSRRGDAARTHCKHGHPLSGANLAIRVRQGRRFRVCIECRRRHNRDARRRALAVAS